MYTLKLRKICIQINVSGDFRWIFVACCNFTLLLICFIVKCVTCDYTFEEF